MAKLRPKQFYLPSGAMITERPILYQTEMVQAILTDRKSKTRRDRNLDFINIHSDEWELCWVGDTVANKKFPKVFGAAFQHRTFRDKVGFVKSPFGKPGDLLWVRETWSHTKQLNINSEDENYGFVYKSDDRIWESYEGWRWKPSIHMPKDAARIWLMIEDIRVERVQEISHGDAIAEGIANIERFEECLWKRYDEGFSTSYPTISFRTLWISINGEESWKSNPWVWVIQFRVLSKTGRPSDEVIQKNLSDLCDFAVNNEKEVANG